MGQIALFKWAIRVQKEDSLITKEAYRIAVHFFRWKAIIKKCRDPVLREKALDLWNELAGKLGCGI